jgi:uncharacterized membrane protein
MLIAFPLALLAVAVTLDIVGMVSRSSVIWLLSYSIMGAGIAGAVIAAPSALIDWVSRPRSSRSRNIGRVHGLGNALALLLFIGSWVMRTPYELPPSAALALSFGAAALALLSAFWGTAPGRAFTSAGAPMR